MEKNSRLSGFTLLEIITIIAIVGILSAIAVPSYLKYIIKAHSAEIISDYGEIRIIVNASIDVSDDCSDIISEIPSEFLLSKYAELNVDFKAVKNGYIPVFKVCAEAATHGKIGIRVARAAYDSFIGKGLILSPKTVILGDSIIAYSVSLDSGNQPVCTNYTPISASGSGCVGAVSVKPVTPPSQPKQSPQTTPQPSQSADYDKNIKKKHRTYQMCAGPPEACDLAIYEDECPESSPFAINKITNNPDGTRSIERKCATREACYNEWWLGCSDDDKCRGFDPNQFYTYYFECSYCCTGNNCNLDQKPPTDSLVSFTNGKDAPTNTAWEMETRSP